MQIWKIKRRQEKRDWKNKHYISTKVLTNWQSLYNVIISYGGNKTYNPASINATVEVKSSIISQNLVKIY